jgi:DNA polymerase II small subunit/DNA polymerase delta subunit B
MHESHSSKPEASTTVQNASKMMMMMILMPHVSNVTIDEFRLMILSTAHFDTACD